jgi:phenylalanyl-tRNA synthetase beta chain
VGLRPINNIVDITNFVLLETGQPLHAFDAARLDGGIRVRLAEKGETFLALDGNSYTLDADNLVIADANRAVALGGVMGGEDTGVTETTTDVVLESALFEPANIRRTAFALGLSTDSSYRFERGVDPEGVLAASRRATDLIVELAGGKPAEGVARAGELPPSNPDVTLRYSRCSALIGTDIAIDRIKRILSNLGLDLVGEQEDSSIWEIPAYRRDLTREVDLIEEVARVHGIDALPDKDTSRFVPASEVDRLYDFRMQAARLLVGAGFFEVRTGTLLPERALRDDLLGQAKPITLKNPLTEDTAALRTSIIPPLLRVVERNVHQGAQSIRLFELGKVYSEGKPEEAFRLAIAMTGGTRSPSWHDKAPRPLDFYDLKGAIQSLGIPALDIRPAENPRVAICAEVLSGDRPLGYAAQVLPARARELDVETPLLIAEIDLDACADRHGAPRRVEELDRFPAVRRDIAILVPEEVEHARILEVLEKAGEELLTGVVLFDVYSDPEGKRLPAGRRSLAYALTYRAKDRTLKAEEVEAAHKRLKDRLKESLKVEFRE